MERGGVGEASLRRVATEAGINIGSVRHYFGSHEALMTAAAEEVGTRTERRLEALSPEQRHPENAAQRRALLEHVGRALMPSSPEERGELVVLVEFITAARIQARFRPLAERMGRDMRAVVRESLRAVGIDDLHVETERFVALLEGLTFELVHPHGAVDAPSAEEVLRRHVTALLPG